MRAPVAALPALAVTVVASVAAGCGSLPGDLVLRLPGGDCRLDEPCAIDFGAIASDTTIAFDVVNDGGTDVALDATAREDGNGGGFALVAAPPAVLAPGASSAIAVAAVAPLGDVPARSGVLFVDWLEGEELPHGLSIPEDAPHLIGVTLTSSRASDAADAACPTIGACDFEAAPVGTSTACALELRNATDSPEIVDEISVTGDGFTLQSLLLPNEVGAGDALVPRITAVPRAPGRNEGTLTVRCGNTGSTATLVVTGT